MTVEALTRIGKAEEHLRSLGFRQLRVRHHDTVARIEVGPEDFAALLAEEVRQDISRYFRSIGYAYVTMDLDGFRSGSMNEVLSADQRARSSIDSAFDWQQDKTTQEQERVMAEYIPSTADWVREQVEAYEGSGGAQGTTLRDTGLPVIIVTNRGNHTGESGRHR